MKYGHVLSHVLPIKISLLFHAVILLSSILCQSNAENIIRKYRHVRTGTAVPRIRYTSTKIGMKTLSSASFGSLYSKLIIPDPWKGPAKKSLCCMSGSRASPRHCGRDEARMWPC